MRQSATDKMIIFDCVLCIAINDGGSGSERDNIASPGVHVLSHIQISTHDRLDEKIQRVAKKKKKKKKISRKNGSKKKKNDRIIAGNHPNG